MAYWLIRSEPDAYSWHEFVAEGRTEWTGVKNATAAINLRAMAPGDEAIFYHSNVGKEAVGVARVTRSAQPDPTDAKWVSVEFAVARPLPRPVTLAAMKAEPRLGDLRMIRQSRLSVSPVTDAEWAVILEMAGE
ncbi:MAG: EVE domain-containing protein [Sphingomonas sp.]